MNWPTRRTQSPPPIRRIMLTVGSLTYLNGKRYLFTITVSGVELQTLETNLRLLGLEQIHLDTNKQEVRIVVIGDFEIVSAIHERTRQLCLDMELTEAWLTDINIENIWVHGYGYKDTQEIITVDDLYQRGAWNPDWSFYFDDDIQHQIVHIRPGNICGYIITAEYGINYAVSANHVVWKQL